MKRTIIAALFAVSCFSASANAGACADAVVAGPTNVTVTNLYTNVNGNFNVTLNNGNGLWIDGAFAGAHNMYQFLLVSWQMGTTIDISAICTWSGVGTQIIAVASK